MLWVASVTALTLSIIAALLHYGPVWPVFVEMAIERTGHVLGVTLTL
jgi:hypothetical protein